MSSAPAPTPESAPAPVPAPAPSSPPMQRSHETSSAPTFEQISARAFSIYEKREEMITYRRDEIAQQAHLIFLSSNNTDEATNWTLALKNLGLYGDPESDWHQAESELLRKPGSVA